MCRKISAFAAFLFCSLNLFAKTSAEIRAEKIVSFNIHTGNASIYFADIGPSVSFFVKHWFLAGISYRYNFLNPITKRTMPGGDSNEFLSALSKHTAHHYFSLDAKFYTGNSFYIKTGIGYDSILISAMNETTRENEYIHTSAFMIPIAFGNTWQWSFVNFGVEWLGIKIPFGQSFSSSPTIGALLQEAQKSDAINEFKKIASMIHFLKSINLFTFSVGVAL